MAKGGHEGRGGEEAEALELEPGGLHGVVVARLVAAVEPDRRLLAQPGVLAKLKRKRKEKLKKPDQRWAGGCPYLEEDALHHILFTSGDAAHFHGLDRFPANGVGVKRTKRARCANGGRESECAYLLSSTLSSLMMTLA
jgi:hypothetical protein